MAKKKAGAKKGKPPPKCKAILLCDQVIIDAFTRKTSLIGIFEKFFISSFPGPTSRFMAYIQLVDGIGAYAVTVEIHDLRENTILARLPAIRIEFPDRTNRAVLVFNAPLLTLPHVGNYDFVVMADGEEIDRQKFEADLPQDQDTQGENSDDGNTPE